jgi:hypothetical protein
VFVLGLLTESVLAGGIPVNQDSSAAKIATELGAHSTRLVAVACLSIVYATGFVIYLWRLHDLVRAAADRLRPLASLVLVGGVLFITMHAVSDIAVTGLLGAKLASYGAAHDPGISYTLYLMTFALDSVGDVFGGLFMAAVALVVLRTGMLPRWLGWNTLLVAILFFLQGFGLGGLIARFGLALDLVAFALFIIFVLASSITLARRVNVPIRTAA